MLTISAGSFSGLSFQGIHKKIIGYSVSNKYIYKIMDGIYFMSATYLNPNPKPGTILINRHSWLKLVLLVTYSFRKNKFNKPTPIHRRIGSVSTTHRECVKHA